MLVHAPWGDFAQYACLLGSEDLKQGKMALFGLILPPGFEAVGDGGPCSQGRFVFDRRKDPTQHPWKGVIYFIIKCGSLLQFKLESKIHESLNNRPRKCLSFVVHPKKGVF